MHRQRDACACAFEKGDAVAEANAQEKGMAAEAKISG